MSCYKINKNLVWREIENKIYIIDPEKEKMHSLNPTAASIWKMLWQGKKIKEIEQKIIYEFDTTDQNIKEDINNIIFKFIKEKLIYEEKKEI